MCVFTNRLTSCKYRRFKVVEGDIDYSVMQRTFIGRMTKGRWFILHSFCRRHSLSEHCSHDFDCCGCLSSQSMEFDYKHNQVTITFTQSFNY